MFSNVSFIPFFVFGFWSLLAKQLQKYANITSLFTYCKARWTRKKKNRKKITQLKWPKYQKPKDKNLGWTKHKKLQNHNFWMNCLKKNVPYLNRGSLIFSRVFLLYIWPFHCGLTFNSSTQQPKDQNLSMASRATGTYRDLVPNKFWQV